MRRQTHAIAGQLVKVRLTTTALVLITLIMLGLCVLQIVKASSQELQIAVTGQSAVVNGNLEPSGSQGENSAQQVFLPANLIGLIASSAGTLVLGISLMILSRRRA